MGSLERACICGFLCRLCSKLSRYVILIYSEEGQLMGLTDKINSCLPVKVTREDKYPKAVCMECMLLLFQHYKMIKQMRSANARIQSKLEESMANNANEV